MAQKKAAASRRPAKRTRKAATPAAAEPFAPQESLVVYVHGVGKHPAPDQLKLEWDFALFGRDLGSRSRMAYWSDLVHPGTPKRAEMSVSTKATEAPLDLDAVLEDAGGAADNDRAREFSLALLRQVGVQDEGPASGPRKKVLPLPAWLRKPISRAFLEAFIADTAAYFFTPKLRERIRKRLLDQLQVPPSQPVTIVAHSQGSIIAYEVLSTLSPQQINLDALVTIGSPLGIREVQDYLIPNTLTVPAVVKRWQNFADPLDPVAADKRLASDFTSLDPNVMVQDVLVMNGQTRRLWGFNPHSAVGYLAHPSVRRVVNDAMRMDVMHRFVIARDVAERLGAASDERHPVLIEVLEPGYRALEEDAETLTQVEMQERLELNREGWDDVPPLKLEHRIDKAAEALSKIVTNGEKARIDPLRRFVAARLTAEELRAVGAAHREMRVYAVWQSSRKAKLTGRSMRVLKADAALTSFGADGNDITWAVLDTGVQADHPHFEGVISAVWDCTRHGRPVKVANAVDRDGHGTHVAGIVAGKAPLAPAGTLQAPERGVAPRTKLVVYKVLDDKGQGGVLPRSRLHFAEA